MHEVVALIIAGGTGQRMGSDTPKQFLPLAGRPVLAHTLAAFETHPDITHIVVVCVEGWLDSVRDIASAYDITKLADVIPGGETGHDSIRSGVFRVEALYGADSIVLVHDAIRPLVSAEIISGCVATTREHGNATTAIHAVEAMLVTDDWRSCAELYPRSRLARTQTPQGFMTGDLAAMHRTWQAAGKPPVVASCELAIQSGHPVFLTLGSEMNVKLTTPDDIAICEALMLTTGTRGPDPRP